MNVLLLFALTLGLPGFALAQLNLNLEYPPFGGFDLNRDQSLPQIIAFFYYLIVGIAGLAAFVMLVWGGVQWLLSGAIPAQASEARDKVRNAIVGLLLVLASFLLIQVLNPELTVVRVNPLETVSIKALSSPAAAPPGESRSGVYLCKYENCRGNRPTDDTTTDNDDWIYIDPTALLPSACLAFPDLLTIDKKCTPDFVKQPVPQFPIAAVAFDDRQYNVALFNGKNYGKDDEEGSENARAICFNESTQSARLDQYQVDPGDRIRFVTDFFGENGWAGDPTSMIIVRSTLRDFPWCTNPGITLKSIGDLSGSPQTQGGGSDPIVEMTLFPKTPPAMVFTFNIINYGFGFAKGKRSITLPLEAWQYKEGDNNRNDDYKEGRNRDIKSILISPGMHCPSSGFASVTGDDPSKPQSCAVRLWAANGTEGSWSEDGDPPTPTAPGLTNSNICFTASVPDLEVKESEGKFLYSFQCNKKESLSGKTKYLEVIQASECTDPRVRQPVCQ